ncbi:MAG: PAS domain-containing protein [Candidatus Cloacimonadaceae bacterium]|nr:PAS domain-containing protein [Candidatus Cloacimonadaceae bacterium]
MDNPHAWIKEFPAAITVCDKDAMVIEMNDKAISTFARYGGERLIGTSLYDCHPPHACEKIRTMLQDGKPMAYTIQRSGLRKMIYQQPWYQDGILAGLVEISIELPDEMPHYDRN